MTSTMSFQNISGDFIQITIHRGAEEIGGNCVEIATPSSRIILDVGMPLSEMGNRKSPSDYTDLVKRGVVQRGAADCRRRHAGWHSLYFV